MKREAEEKINKGYNFLIDAMKTLKEAEKMISIDNWDRIEIERIQETIILIRDAKAKIAFLF